MVNTKLFLKSQINEVTKEIERLTHDIKYEVLELRLRAKKIELEIYKDLLKREK